MMDLIADYAEPFMIIIGAMGAVGAAILWMYRKLLKPSVLMLIALQELVEFQFKPNGGTSLVDKIDKIEKRLHKIEIATATPKEVPLDNQQRLV